MAESLYIKNFGPIKEARLDIRDVNVFIGPTSSGKSVAAKLISVFRCRRFRSTPTKQVFEKLLIDFNIPFPLTKNSQIVFEDGNFIWSVKKSKIETNDIETREILKLVQILPLMDSGVLSLPLFQSSLKNTIGEYLKQTTSDRDKSKQGLESEKKTTDAIDEESQIKEFIEAIVLKEGGIQLFMNELLHDLNIPEIVYVPAERNLLSMVGENSFGFMTSGVIRLPQCFLDFGNNFQKARRELKSIKLSSLNVNYRLEGIDDIIGFEDGSEVSLVQSSSGIQSTVPLELVFSMKGKSDFFSRLLVVEEPEMNLFPKSQKSLVEFMTGIVISRKDKLIATTHSPYVVTAVANLVLAGETGKLKGRKTKVKSIVPESQWLDFDQVSCYQFENGTVKDLRDNEMRTIDGSAIDDVSDEMSSVFHQLLELKYS